MGSSRRVGDDPCVLARRWVLAPALATLLIRLDGMAARDFSAQGFRWPGLWIISGYRSPQLQARVNPSVTKSLHTLCPSLAADLRVGDLPASITTDEIWRFLGERWELLGGRWGGRFTPPDVNHFDLKALAFV